MNDGRVYPATLAKTKTGLLALPGIGRQELGQTCDGTEGQLLKILSKALKDAKGVRPRGRVVLRLVHLQVLV